MLSGGRTDLEYEASYHLGTAWQSDNCFSCCPEVQGGKFTLVTVRNSQQKALTRNSPSKMSFSVAPAREPHLGSAPASGSVAWANPSLLKGELLVDLTIAVPALGMAVEPLEEED